MATSPRSRRAVPARALLATAAGLLALLAVTRAVPVSAQTAVDAVVEEVAASGSYVAQDGGDDVASAIDEANGDNIAVVLLDDQTDARPFARDLQAQLQDRGSPYRTVLVVSLASAGAASSVVDDIPTILADGEPTFEALEQGRNADGIRLFTEAVTGADTPPPATGGDGGDGDGGGFPWTGLVVAIAVIGLGAGGWWLVRERRRNRRAEALVEAQRAEIGEQLRNNADKVIALGDRVLAKGDPELIDLYASASDTYRDVSHRIELARTAEAVRQLDQRMDDAEWRLEVIEARLAGRTPPPPPTTAGSGDATDPAAGGPPPPPAGGAPPLAGPPPAGGPPPPTGPPAAPTSDRPAAGGGSDDGPVLGRDESLFGTVLPHPPPRSRLPGVGRGGRRRGWPGSRR